MGNLKVLPNVPDITCSPGLSSQESCRQPVAVDHSWIVAEPEQPWGAERRRFLCAQGGPSACPAAPGPGERRLERTQELSLQLF